MSARIPYWTAEFPTEHGHYWWRTGASDRLDDYHVIRLYWNLAREPFIRLSGVTVHPKDIGGEWWPAVLKPPTSSED